MSTAPNDERAGSGAAAFGSRRSLCIHKQLRSEEECPLLLLLTARCLTTAEPHSDRQRERDRENERAQREGTFTPLRERTLLAGSQMEWNGFKMVRMLQ